MRRTLAILGILAISAGALPVFGQTVSLAGTWKLNPGESDKPMEKLQEATSAAPQVREGYGSTRDRVGAGRIDGEKGGGGSSVRSGGGGASLPGVDFARIMRPAATITIEQDEATLTIRDDQGLPQILYLDGRKSEEPMPGAEPKLTTAKWKDGKLTVERKLGGTGSIKETFTLETEKKQLVVEAKLTSPTLGKTVEIRRVYDAGS